MPATQQVRGAAAATATGRDVTQAAFVLRQQRQSARQRESSNSGCGSHRSHTTTHVTANGTRTPEVAITAHSNSYHRINLSQSEAHRSRRRSRQQKEPARKTAGGMQ